MKFIQAQSIMNTKHSAPLVCCLCAMLVATVGLAEETRSWTSSKTGRQFSGSLVKVEGDSISIKRVADKVVFQVKKADLVPDDWNWIQQNMPGAAPAADATGPVEDLSDLIAGVTAATGTPAVGVLLVVDGKTAGLGVSGFRKAGDEAKVEANDKWHLGSCTKSMTATIAATFVEEGAITWETTLAEILGKEIKMHEEYGPITLGLLLANRSGITGDTPDSVYEGVQSSTAVGDLKDRELVKLRAQYVEAVLNLPPSSAPNTKYEYSNAGFVVAGAMLEQVAGKPWERLIEERIFKPLGMTDSGFGNAARDDKKDPTQPWPHNDGPKPVEPGPGDDNPWVIGPAGTVHCSLKDISRYIAMHANHEIGPVLKKAETYKFLHTAVPENNNYARGWIVGSRGWTEGPAISHNGTNTMNHCSFWIAPERKAAVAAFTNCNEKGSDVCRSAIELVVEKYLK